MLSICKRFEFCYGHFLPFHEGKCKVQHGHNAILEVEVTADICEVGPERGMVTDFSALKAVVESKVVDVLDHKFLNSLFPTAGISENPTVENILIWCVQTLRTVFEDNLSRVRLYETPDSYAEWRAK